jgi:hypothetical protein
VRDYPVRPLACRLFGIAAARGKRGETRFKACPEHRRMDAYISRGAEDILGTGPPVISDYGATLATLDPQNEGSMPVKEAVTAALNKLRLLEQFILADLFGGFPPRPSEERGPALPLISMDE